MNFNPLDPLRLAFRRLVLYSELISWLCWTGYIHARRAVLTVPVMAIAAVTLQALAFLLISEVLRQVGSHHLAQPQGGDRSGLLGSIASWLQGIAPVTLVLPVTMLLALSGLARFISGTLAIQSYGKVAIGSSRDLLGAIAALPGDYERWQFLRKHDRVGITRALQRDCSLCGMSVRIMLFNLISLFFLLAGAAVLLAIAPRIFVALIVISALGLMIAYPLNLSTIRVTRNFERMNKLRPQDIRKVVEATLAGPEISGDVVRPIQLNPDVERDFAEGLTGNFLMVERFHFLLAMLFAVAVAAALFYIARDMDAIVIDPQLLVLLFVAFRYTYSGLQGLLICVTTINRFLPSIQRLHAMHSLLAELKTPQPHRVATGKVLSEATQFAWRVSGVSEETALRGALKPGMLCVIVESQRNHADVLFRLLDILTSDHDLFAQEFRSARIASAGVRKQAAIRSQWQDETMELVEPSRRDDAAIILDEIDRLAALDLPVVVLDDWRLLMLPEATMQRVWARLGRRLVLLVIPWNDCLDRGVPVDILFVSNGAKIGLALTGAGMDEANMRKAAAFYREKPSAFDDADDRLRDDDLDM
jgi:ABC-type multidrug transport system fused ATPase/permease subunit